MQDRNSLGLDLATLYTQVARKKRQGFLTQQVRPDLCPIRSVRLGIIASQDNQVGALKLVLVFLMPNTGRDQHQSGQCADDDRIDERLQQGNHAFRDRILGLGRRMGDRGRSLSRLVGEKATVYAPIESQRDRRPEKSARRRRSRENASKNSDHRRPHLIIIIDKDTQRAQNIDNRHERGQLLRHLGDSLNAADDNQCQDHG